MKKLLVITLLIAACTVLSSCTGSERLTHMTIVQGLALDVENQRIVATVQYLDLNKSSGKNEDISGNIISCESADGMNIKSAIKNVGRKMPDALFFGQNKIIVISPEFEKLYGRDLREYLIKNKESRPDVYILRSEDKAADVVKNAHKNTRVPADSICRQLEKSHSEVTVSEYLAGDRLLTYTNS
ncbi:MAG: hypothetical protein IJI47_00295 [Eubacterium sp.]|nr:hypothetical protein [Eubacterium sp.]